MCNEKKILMQKVAIIGTVGIPSKYGGFETLAHQITKHLNKNFRFRVYCSSKAYSNEERLGTFNNSELVYVPLNANGAQSVIYDLVSIIHALFFADVLLILGVSGCLFLPFVKWFTKVRIITNIDGLEWRRNKWNKLAKEFLKISEFMAVKFSHEVITDNKAIQEYVKNSYGEESTFIAYGGNHVIQQSSDVGFLASYGLTPKSYAFKVARIEPENNVHLILSAFDKLNQKLVVVGNWEASAYGRELKSKYKFSSSILIIDPIYDQSHLDQLRQNCRVYVHGHSAGGTNPSLVEAMSLGLPVLAFDVVYNRETTIDLAKYFSGEAELIKLLNSLNTQVLNDLGAKMLYVAQTHYTWAKISSKYRFALNALSTSYESQDVISKPSWSMESVNLGVLDKLNPKNH